MKRIYHILLFLLIMIPFMVKALPIGDVNADNKVSTQDYILVRKHIMGTKLTGDKLIRADVNSDNKVNLSDYILIRKIILGSVSLSNKAKVIDSKYSYNVINYNVLDYGADPTGVKDSTAAFTNALNAAANCIKSSTKNCGGVVYAPKGKYLITKPLYLYHYTALIGDLDEGTTNGTILMIKHSSGSTDYNKGAIMTDAYSSVSNIAFWYPDQKIDSNGNPVKYPPTIIFGTKNPEGVTLENLYFVNSYTAIDLASARNNNSIMFVRNIYGTPLHVGLVNDTNYDTIKMSNINFSSKYWLNSGMSNIPSKSSLLNALKNTNNKPTAILLERVDWFFVTNVNIENYYMGFKFQKTTRSGVDGTAEGVIYDTKITDCYYPMYIDKSNHITLTNVTLLANKVALYVNSGNNYSYSINNSDISSLGDYAIYYSGNNPISIVNSKINGKINDIKKFTIVGSGLNNTRFDGCSSGTSIDINKKSYDKIIVTKPKSKNLIMIEASEKTDITSKINNAINKLKSTGGIVYIPSGTYTISNHINVISGIEIRGIASWAHHEGTTGATVIETTYKGDTLFTLQSNSGINGLQIYYPENRKSTKPVSYPYAIKGNGSNIYIKNVGLISAWNGIDLSSVRCDNHYLEHIWGTFFNKGIIVGAGSTNGIIRDSHFTTNLLQYGNGVDAVKLSSTNQIVFDIGNSNNETILNTFIYDTNIGYQFRSGATNFNAINIGTDQTSTAIKLSGNATGQIINPMLYTRETRVVGYRGMTTDLGIEPSNNHYIVSTSDYSGNINIFNPICFGNDKATAFDLSGSGRITISSGIIEKSSSPAIKSQINTLSTHGLVFNQPVNNTKYTLNSGSRNIEIIGNIASDGKSVTDKIINNARISYNNVEFDNNCKLNTTMNSSTWQKTTLNNTIINRSSATTKICNLPIQSGTMEYYSECNGTKSTSVSGGCASITLNSCNKKQTLTYRMRSGNNTSWDTVYNIGEYLLLAQEYNQLLYINTPASNDSLNLGYHIVRCTSIATCLKNTSEAIINKRAGDSNKTYLQYAFKGILGRNIENSDLNYWLDRLNKGTSRLNAFNEFIDSNEAKTIYSAWGY